MIGFFIGLPIGIVIGILLTLIYMNWALKRGIERFNGELQKVIKEVKKDPYDHLQTAINQTENSIDKAEQIMGEDRH